MRRRLVVATVFLLVVFLASCAVRTAEFEPVIRAGEVSPVQAFTHNRQAICTTFSIGGGYWLTAGHCWKPGVQLGIAGAPAIRIKHDVPRDLLLVQAMLVNTRALPPGLLPMVSDPVRSIGFPAWFRAPPTLHGRVALIGLEPNTYEEVVGMVTVTRTIEVQKVISDICSGPGMSGAPLVNASAAVVGLVTGSLSKPCLDAAVSVRELQAFAGEYWQAGQGNGYH